MQYPSFLAQLFTVHPPYWQRDSTISNTTPQKKHSKLETRKINSPWGRFLQNPRSELSSGDWLQPTRQTGGKRSYDGKLASNFPGGFSERRGSTRKTRCSEDFLMSVIYRWCGQDMFKKDWNTWWDTSKSCHWQYKREILAVWVGGSQQGWAAYKRERERENTRLFCVWSAIKGGTSAKERAWVSLRQNKDRSFENWRGDARIVEVQAHKKRSHRPVTWPTLACAFWQKSSCGADNALKFMWGNRNCMFLSLAKIRRAEKTCVFPCGGTPQMRIETCNAEGSN